MKIGNSLLPLLALLAGGIPLVAVHLALHVSVSHGLVEPCNPYLDGCTSISRAGRHGLANQLFQSLMLPYAAVLAAYWLVCACWLRGLGEKGAAVRWLPWLGVVAALFLVLYVMFLGTEGDIYRLLRRYGVIVYFAGNYLAQLLLAGRLLALTRRGQHRWPAWLAGATVALCVVVLMLGLGNVAGSLLLDDNDAFENIIEWNAALVMTAYFFVTCFVWRGSRTGPGGTWRSGRAGAR